MRYFYIVGLCILLSGCFTFPESSERFLNQFEISKDRVYLAIPEPYSQFGTILRYNPISQNQFKECDRSDCKATYVLGAPMGGKTHDNRMDIYIGPEGQRYRIASVPYKRSGRFAFFSGWTHTGVSEITIYPDKYSHVLNITPGSVHVIGYNVQATSKEVATVRAVLRNRYGSAVDQLNFRSVEVRAVSCKAPNNGIIITGKRVCVLK